MNDIEVKQVEKIADFISLATLYGVKIDLPFSEFDDVEPYILRDSKREVRLGKHVKAGLKIPAIKGKTIINIQAFGENVQDAATFERVEIKLKKLDDGRKYIYIDAFNPGAKTKNILNIEETEADGIKIPKSNVKIFTTRA